MQLPFVYQTIDIPNYASIHYELESFALDHSAHCHGVFNHVDIHLLESHCPLITQWFSTHNLTPKICALIQFPPGSDQGGAHTDSTQDRLALNFGIKNLLHTWTAFYILKSGEPVQKTHPLGRPWDHYAGADLEEIGRVNLVKPTLINVAVPHAVHNPTDDTRISVSFRFDQNPWHLI